MSDIKKINRRKFIGKSSKFVAAATVFPMGLSYPSFEANSFKKLRVALVGTGSRGSSTWGKDLVDSYSDYVEMVGLCDSNYKRLAVAKKRIGSNAKTYVAEDFDLMISETKPDSVIVTTMDSQHEKYIVRAMELGCNVISEKPVATEADQCQRIIDAETRTGQRVDVTFNVRYMMESDAIKNIILSGDLGRIVSIDFQEYLDVNHGASYYRRWHGKIKNSGSLLVHKASHHFDMVNWLIDAEPLEIKATGRLAFYGKNNAYRDRNCRTCSFKEKCKFYWDMTKSKNAMELYGACEDVDGYYRDGCIWDNEIDSYDTSAVEVLYDNGTILNYSMNAFMPYEGQRISLTGEKGRLDVRIFARQPWETEHSIEMRLSKNFGESKLWGISPPKGGHGGADSKLKDMLLKPNQSDPLSKRAGSRAGILSSLIGIAARESIETGETIEISNLIKFA
jgi:predicted dehydrogenase